MPTLSKFKLSIAYILNKKWLLVGIGIIGLGIGLGTAEFPTDTNSTKNKETEAPADTNSTKNKETEAPVDDQEKEQGILKALSSKLGFWLNIVIIVLGLAIVVGLGVGLVRCLIFKRRTSWLFKRRTSWLWMVIVCLGVAIVGLGVGLIIADPLHKNISRIGIFWLEIVIICLGVAIAWVELFKYIKISLLTGILTVVVAAVGVILAELSSGKLPKKVENIVSPLTSLATHTSDIDTRLQNVVTNTSDIDTRLQNVVTNTSDIDTTLQKLVKKNSVNNAYLKAIKDSLTEAGKHVAGQIQQLKKKINKYQSNTDSQTVKALQAEIALISKDLEFQLKSQKATTRRIKDELESQKATTKKIRQKLDKARQVQNSVRLLVGTEQNLIDYGFLITKTRFIFIKSYRLSREFSAEDTLVTTGKPFPLESASQKLVGGSGPLELEALVSHSGKLKEYAYTIVKGDSTYITFKSFLGGMDILAVVKKN